DDLRQRVHDRDSTRHWHTKAAPGVSIREGLVEVDPGHLMSVQEVECRGDFAGEHPAVLEVSFAPRNALHRFDESGIQSTVGSDAEPATGPAGCASASLARGPL